MPKIVIIGLNNANLGDRVILETCNYLVSKIAAGNRIQVINLFPPNESMKKHKITPKKNYLLQICTFLRWLYHSNLPEIDIITSFSGIFAGRLHANIIATSYKIPSVGLIWNDKLKLFGNLIGHPERFVTKEQFKNPNYVADVLEKAITEGYDTERIEQLKLATLNNLKDFIDSYSQ